MYYPLLRGRQNELLAIQELLNQDRLSDSIIPVIEPVKLSPTLVNTLQAFKKAGREIVFIRNPQVGSYYYDEKNSKNEKYNNKLSELLNDSDTIRIGLNVNRKLHSFLESSVSLDENDYDRIVALCVNNDSKTYFEKQFGNHSIKTIIPFDPDYLELPGDHVFIDDKFNKRERNADYKKEPDELFSRNHLLYKNYGFVGFSDYSIIGREYSESGFAPYAVAIHIVYFDEGKNLRVHHFVSDDNEDAGDPAGKFYQALTKLVEWNKSRNSDTLGMQKFLEMYENESYPGLGMIKKLSIMHHLELMGDYLDRLKK